MKYVLSILLFVFFSQHVFCGVGVYQVNENIRLIIKIGDITQCHVEAIVNAANEQLAEGAGVCGAIFKAAGRYDLQRSCDEYPVIDMIRCPVGNACITDSFHLKKLGINYIIHAVGPDCRIIKDIYQQDLLLMQAYKNSLILADQYSIKSLAFPFISSAIYAFPKERAAKIAVGKVIDYLLTQNTQIKEVCFVLFSQADFDLFNAQLQQIQGADAQNKSWPTIIWLRVKTLVKQFLNLRDI